MRPAPQSLSPRYRGLCGSAAFSLLPPSSPDDTPGQRCPLSWKYCRHTSQPRSRGFTGASSKIESLPSPQSRCWGIGVVGILGTHIGHPRRSVDHVTSGRDHLLLPLRTRRLDFQRRNQSTNPHIIVPTRPKYAPIIRFLSYSNRSVACHQWTRSQLTLRTLKSGRIEAIYASRRHGASDF